MHAAQNYIYIVFAILYVIYSIVKAVKKGGQQNPETKKPEQPSTVRPPTASPLPNSGDGPDSYREKKMLEDLFGGVPREKNREQQVPKSRPQPVPVKPPLRQKVESPSYTRPAKIAAQIKKEKAIVSRLPLKTEKAGTKSFLAGERLTSSEKNFIVPIANEEPASDNYLQDFDIRQAVLYSEILKRPNW